MCKGFHFPRPSLSEGFPPPSADEVWLVFEYPTGDVSTLSVSVGASIRMTPTKAKVRTRFTVGRMAYTLLDCTVGPDPVPQPGSSLVHTHLKQPNGTTVMLVGFTRIFVQHELL